MDRIRKTAGFLFIVALSLLSACTTISVTSPDGKSTVSYKGTTILGNAAVYCNSSSGGTTCGEESQNLLATAAALAPIVGPMVGVPVPPTVGNPRPPAAQ